MESSPAFPAAAKAFCDVIRTSMVSHDSVTGLIRAADAAAAAGDATLAASLRNASAKLQHAQDTIKAINHEVVIPLLQKEGL